MLFSPHGNTTGATAFTNHDLPRQMQTPTTTSTLSNHSGLVYGVVTAVTIIFILSTTVIITTIVMIKQRSKKTLHVSSGMALSNQVYSELPYTHHNLNQHAFNQKL